MSAWQHLPNAKYIDRVLTSVNETPEKWIAAHSASRGVDSTEIPDSTWTAAMKIAYNYERVEAYYETYYAVRDAAYAASVTPIIFESWWIVRDAAWDVLLALVIYDESAYMMYSDPDELRVLAALGDTRAILMLPAAYVFR